MQKPETITALTSAFAERPLATDHLVKDRAERAEPPTQGYRRQRESLPCCWEPRRATRLVVRGVSSTAREMPTQLPRTTPLRRGRGLTSASEADERTGLGGAADGDNNT